MTRRIALLRGINVGGHRKVPMADLRAALADLGATNVATLVQSGNIALDTDLDEPETTALAESAIETCSGLTDVPVVLREAHEVEVLIEAVLAGAGDEGADFVGGAGVPVDLPADDPKKLHVVFTQDRGTPQRMAGAEMNSLAELIAPDVFCVVSSHIVLHTPNGLGRSKAELHRWEKLTGDRCTIRNWNTVSKLVNL